MNKNQVRREIDEKDWEQTTKVLSDSLYFVISIADEEEEDDDDDALVTDIITLATYQPHLSFFLSFSFCFA
jgi:hypothetical protein